MIACKPSINWPCSKDIFYYKRLGVYGGGAMKSSTVHYDGQAEAANFVGHFG